MAEYAQRMESFPFDSSPDVEYDEDGYPIYDRAVGAEAMRRTFEKFFSDGVFPNPAGEMQVSAGDSGLTVKVAPGTCIIKGSMGTLLEEVTLTLDTAVQGNTVYGIMAAFDNNENRRSIYLRVAKGVPGTNTPPEPDRNTPNIYEYRIADVNLATGATSVSAASITNNKGTSVWPYAAPFEEIDMSAVTADARASANEALTQLLAYFESNREAIDAALSGEAVTYLQQQITALQEQLADFDIDLANEVDNATIEYTGTDNPVDQKKLRVKDGGIGTSKIADGAVTEDKIEPTLMSHLEWATAAGSRQTGNIPVSSLSGPTWESMGSLLDPSEAETLWTGSWKNGSITVSGVSGYRVLYVEGIRGTSNSVSSDQFRGFAYALDDRIEGTIPYSSTSYSGVALVLIRRSGDSLTGEFREAAQYIPAVLMQFESQYSVSCTINTIKGVF